ncbi:taurine transport system substrate-binding protein [Sinobacterium caligoides]|uniref:Taurine transport system substrate-binding protein n=1 Tax=Sinobacterium caligoides TaxID=933926 RepID=A0A3N2DPH3_9GAMM|nr:taurine ABC transporter substrate-binding protein [Sinobacterium caligoides]ROS01711.1 taurine transport system substrate-binding protein [Sinobacterium caligoides]
MRKYIKRNVVDKLLLVTLLAVFTQVAQAEQVTIGYQGMFNPWKYAIEEKMIEKATGYEIKWRRFGSGAKAMTAVASGNVQVAVAGSSPIASAVSRGVDIQLVWILENIADAEALVVREGAGIMSPSDLRGKRLAVPFVSTTHFHALFALQQFGLSEKDVKVINMQPSAIAAAWQRGDIDAAFIWDPVLQKIKTNGKVLISSAMLSSWGKPTFDGLVVDKAFGEEHQEFVSKLIKVIASVDEKYRATRDNLGTNNPMIAAIAKLSGSTPNAVTEALALYDFPSLDRQLSCEWLQCEQDGGAAKALKATSEFLKQQRKINRLQQDYSQFVNPTYAQQAQSNL